VGESRRLPALGLHLHCVEAGQGDPLVMVHGLGGSWDNWLPVLAPLSGRHRCLVPDLPGFGRSIKPEAPYSVGWFAEVLRDLLRGAGALPAVLAGNSLGGHICLEFARRWPADVRALILSAPGGAHAGARPLQLALLNLFAFLGRGPLTRALGPFVLPYFIRRLFHQCGPECREEIYFYRRYLRSPEYALFWRAGVRAARSHLASSLRGHLGEIDTPALIIAGRHDVVIPLAEVREMARRLPRSELVVFEECGHVPQVEWPERFVEEVERFLGGR
jgi:4,5:9,10-diseco-3-hydroxy-5,9,17-trioxoandrosta-1(10),2-diene-4-oate hydrolase